MPVRFRPRSLRYNRYLFALDVFGALSFAGVLFYVFCTRGLPTACISRCHDIKCAFRAGRDLVFGSLNQFFHFAKRKTRPGARQNSEEHAYDRTLGY